MNADIRKPLPIALNPWEGVHAQIFADTTDEVDVEGAQDSAKTTLCLDKEIHFLREYPGIHSFMFRYSDTDTRTKLRPAFEELCDIRAFTDYRWDADEMCYLFANTSKMYAFGLKAQDSRARYSKLRGLGVARIYNDQSEELPADIAIDLRPRLRQRGYRHQLTFSPNPPGTSHWLAKKDQGGFPTDNSFHGRRYYAVSLFDNAYNLPPETIARLERTYPPDHARYKAVILGKRGPNIIGDAVYEHVFKRVPHVRDIRFGSSSRLLEAFDVWKHNPCWVAAERPYAGGLWFHAGIIGEGLFLEDFLSLVKVQRAAWFPGRTLETCCTATSKGKDAQQGSTRYTATNILREAGLAPQHRDNGNDPDIVLAMIERLAGYMRKRNAMGEESFGITADESRWLRASREGLEPCPFLAEGFEAGYVWDEHFVSVGSKQVRQPKDDNWFEHGMNCVNALELNFGANQPTDDETAKRKAKAAARVAQSRFSDFGNRSDGWLAS